MTAFSRFARINVLALLVVVAMGEMQLHGGELIEPVSAPPMVSSSATGPSFFVQLSSDGRQILFLSAARNLTTDDGLDGHLNLYSHDRLTGETVLVSQSFSGRGGGNGDAAAASASTNGLVAFMSSAGNLIVGDTNASADVFLRDLNQNTTRLVSVAIGGGTPARIPHTNQALAGNPLISPDGRLIAFEGRAKDLVTLADTNNASDVFLYDVVSQSVRAVSISTNGTAMANGASRLGAVSADGRWIAFLSRATDLVPGGPVNRNDEVYLHDTVTGKTICISAGLPLPYPNAPAYLRVYRCFSPVLSADGSAVAFKALVENATRAAVVHCRTGGCSVVTMEADLRSEPQISADGATVLYDANGQIYVGSSLVSTGLPSGMVAHTPVMTPDGNKVAYVGTPRSGAAQIFLRDLTQPSAMAIPGATVNDLVELAIDAHGNIIFESGYDRASLGDNNEASDVFLYDPSATNTTLISSRHDLLVPRTARGLAFVGPFSLSADGRKLVFVSAGGDLAPGDSNDAADAFARDLESGKLIALTGTNGTSFDPAISADGRYVTFSMSPTSSLAPRYLARANLETGEQELVADWINNGSHYNSRKLFAPLSADGRLVVYNSGGRPWIRDMTAGTNWALTGYVSALPRPTPILSPDETAVLYSDSPSQLMLHDLSTGSNTQIGLATKGYGFSANSRYVIYPGFRYDRQTGSNEAVCTSCANLSISGDGRYVAYEKVLTTSRAIELRDMEANSATLISQNAYGTNGNGRSTSPVISHDGAFVVFASRASDLVPGDNNGTADLFVYDTRTRKLIRITGELPDGPQGAGPASNPVLAADGRTLAFQSFSALMVTNDFDQQGDIFVMRLGAADSDNDGLPDYWEVAHFNNLEQGATGDFDEDGYTNAQEYGAGTDPTNEGSALRVIAVMSSTTGSVQLYWSSVPGKRYRVEYKATVTETQWTSLPGLYTAGSATDPNTTFGPAKFYRVVAVD